MPQYGLFGSIHGNTIAFALATLVLGSSASALAASTIVSARNSSDPRARVFNGKLYLYTSSDMNQSGNWPMNKTYNYSLKDDTADPGLAASWTDNGAVLSESDYAWSMKQNHLWAPDAFQTKDGKIYLYVPDTYNSAGGSRIGVSVSNSPLGPFVPPSGLTSSTNYLPSVTGYMSDPSGFVDPNDPNGQAYVVYADGDYNSSNFGCGHISIAKLDPEKSTISGNQKLQWTNQGSIPNAGGCTPAYIEGPELGYFGGAGKDGNGKYFLYFAIKDNTSYTESIGYGTADTVMGPYTYQGIIMSGQGGSGWTNQASIVEWQGHYLFFYHNDIKNQANPNRQVFLECVGIQNGKIAPVTRGTYKNLDSCPKASSGMTSGTPDAGVAPDAGQGGSIADGGLPATGGSIASGGGNMATGGTTATGGTAATGGTPSGNGGSSSAGGAKATGGSTATGGSPSTGGIAATGGVTASGGRAGGSNTGGTVASGSGGVSAGTGGVSTSGTGGSTATTGTGGRPAGTGGSATGGNKTTASSQGGGCTLGATATLPGSTKATMLVFAALLGGAWRRRAKKRTKSTAAPETHRA